jgi:hypothetical protein
MALADAEVILHSGTLVSMYADILDSAFAERPGMKSPPTVTEAVKELLDRWKKLASTRAKERPIDWAATALANQVAYDVALIDLARSVGIACNPATFEQPELRRNELNRELAARGVHLHHAAQAG